MSLRAKIEEQGRLLRTEWRADLNLLRADLTAQITNQTRTMIITLLTIVVAIAAMALFQG